MHNEWFEVGEETARKVMGLWTLFADQVPYGRLGELGDFWLEKIEDERSRVGEGDSAMGWLEKMPRFVEESRRWDMDRAIGPRMRLSA